VERAGGDGLAVDACGRCSACSRIPRQMHPDVLVLEPADSGSIKVEPVREAIDFVAYRPFEGRRRVVVVDEADALVVSAQSALLKSLEEPPPASLFVLVTARPETLLPTVRSRCQRLRFGTLTPAQIAGVLMARYRKPEEQARAAAAVANGSLGRALEAVESDLGEVREAAFRALTEFDRVEDPRRRLDKVKGLARKRPAAASAGNERDDLAVHLQALGSLLRDVALLSARGQEPALANADRKSQLDELARSYGGRRALRAFGAVDRALDALERNASPKIVLDWLAFQV